LDILADLVSSPRFAKEDIAKEKGVVLEEIRMVEDDPQEKVFDLFTEKIWNHGHPLSRPILGWPETVSKLNRTELLKQHAFYHPANFVLTAAGAVKPEDVIRAAQKQFGTLKPGPKSEERVAPQTNTHFHLEDRDLQQAHLCLGLESINRHDERRFALDVLNTILGGGMSSRLFKRIREDLGLAYSVFSSPNFFLDTGLFIVYIGTEPSNARQTLEITQEEIIRLTKEPVSKETLRIAKEKLKGNMLLALETSNARMVRLGLGEIYSMHTTLETLAAKIEAVNAEDIIGIAQAIFSNKKLSLCLVGPETELSSIQSSLN
jgi:predicted Zn-dependent peptidase